MNTKTKAKITAKDYVKLVEWSEEDGVFIGSAPPLIGQCCHGADEAKVYQELCQIVAEWMSIYAKDGRPLPEPSAGREYTGKFILRMKPELHRALALRASAVGDSLNNYVVKKLQPVL
jgi:predicted HicB family RNase H-like nuclease